MVWSECFLAVRTPHTDCSVFVPSSIVNYFDDRSECCSHVTQVDGEWEFSKFVPFPVKLRPTLHAWDRTLSHRVRLLVANETGLRAFPREFPKLPSQPEKAGPAMVRRATSVPTESPLAAHFRNRSSLSWNQGNPHREYRRCRCWGHLGYSDWGD
jgi:hypothetical protein